MKNHTHVNVYCSATFTGLLHLSNEIANTLLVALLGTVLFSQFIVGQNIGGEMIYPEKESLFATFSSTVACLFSTALTASLQVSLK